jgi:hypothetical protein
MILRKELQMKLLQFGALIIGCYISLPLLADKEPIKTNCNNQAICTVLEIKTGKVLLGDLPATPTIRALSHGIFEIKTSCGSPCSASAYYDQTTGKISELFPDVVSISPEAGKVVFAADGKIMYSSIFSSGKKPCQLKTNKPLAVTASVVSAIISAEFVAPTKVKLTYLSGADFKEVTEILTLNSVTTR